MAGLSLSQINNILSDTDSEENLFASAGSDSEEDEVLSDNRSVNQLSIPDGESLASDIEENVEISSQQTYPSKDGKYMWSEKSDRSSAGRYSTENILNTVPGPTQYAISRVTNIKSAFELFIPPDVEKIIIEMSNTEGK